MEFQHRLEKKLRPPATSAIASIISMPISMSAPREWEQENRRQSPPDFTD